MHAFRIINIKKLKQEIYETNIYTVYALYMYLVFKIWFEQYIQSMRIAYTPFITILFLLP